MPCECLFFSIWMGCHPVRQLRSDLLEDGSMRELGQNDLDFPTIHERLSTPNANETQILNRRRECIICTHNAFPSFFHVFVYLQEMLVYGLLAICRKSRETYHIAFNWIGYSASQNDQLLSNRQDEGGSPVWAHSIQYLGSQ